MGRSWMATPPRAPSRRPATLGQAGRQAPGWVIARSPPLSPSGRPGRRGPIPGHSYLSAFLAPVAPAAIRGPLAGGVTPPWFGPGPALSILDGPPRRPATLARFNRRLGLPVDEELAAPVALRGDQGGVGGPGRLLPEAHPGPVAGAAIRGRWWASALFGLSTGTALSKFDSDLADRAPRARPGRGWNCAVKI
jgi:hypothetical protein